MHDESALNGNAAEAAFAVGEKVHIVQHRRFDTDVRRHFVGEIQYHDANHLRIVGYMFVYDESTGIFKQVPAERTRVFAIDNDIAITILPPNFDMSRSSYQRDDSELVFTDGGAIEMEFGAFGVHG